MADPSPRKYFKPQIAQRYEHNIRTDSTVEVTCYYNGFFWVCPNPFNEEIAQDIERQYYRHVFVAKMTYNIPKSVFDDPASWNP